MIKATALKPETAQLGWPRYLSSHVPVMHFPTVFNHTNADQGSHSWLWGHQFYTATSHLPPPCTWTHLMCPFTWWVCFQPIGRAGCVHILLSQAWTLARHLANVQASLWHNRHMWNHAMQEYGEPGQNKQLSCFLSASKEEMGQATDQARYMLLPDQLWLGVVLDSHDHRDHLCYLQQELSLLLRMGTSVTHPEWQGREECTETLLWRPWDQQEFATSNEGTPWQEPGQGTALLYLTSSSWSPGSCNSSPPLLDIPDPCSNVLALGHGSSTSREGRALGQEPAGGSRLLQFSAHCWEGEDKYTSWISPTPLAQTEVSGAILRPVLNNFLEARGR